MERYSTWIAIKHVSFKSAGADQQRNSAIMFNY